MGNSESTKRLTVERSEEEGTPGIVKVRNSLKVTQVIANWVSSASFQYCTPFNILEYRVVYSKMVQDLICFHGFLSM